VSRVVARYDDPLTIRARDIMTSDLVIAREGTQLAKLTEQMRARGIRRVPIVDGKGRLVNILTLDDMLVVFGEEIANCHCAAQVTQGPTEYGLRDFPPA
jgi:CBS-domain-containing membrane protein